MLPQIARILRLASYSSLLLLTGLGGMLYYILEEFQKAGAQVERRHEAIQEIEQVRIHALQCSHWLRTYSISALSHDLQQAQLSAASATRAAQHLQVLTLDHPSQHRLAQDLRSELFQTLEIYFRQAGSARQQKPGPLKETAVARMARDATGLLTARLDELEAVERELLGFNRAREQQRLNVVEQLLLGAVAVAEAALLWSLRYSWRLLRVGEHEVRQLQTRASLDPLTQLLNRRGLEEFMAVIVRQLSINAGLPVALLALDLDDFKPVNDRFGHAAGDEVLQAVARRLAEQCRSGDAVARVGGDEFVVVLRSVSSQGAAVAIAERIRSRITEPVEVDAATVSVDTSIGIAMLRHGEPDVAAALRAADKYLYLAKRSGKGTIRVGDSPAD